MPAGAALAEITHQPEQHALDGVFAAAVSRRLINAPYPADTTTPVSSNRVTDQRLPALASVKTNRIDRRALLKAL